jgi:hypothetical protein
MTLKEFCQKQGASAIGKPIWPDLPTQFPIEVQIPNALRTEAIYDVAASWAKNAFDTNDFVEIAYRYFFKSAQDAMQFRLAWCL